MSGIKNLFDKILKHSGIFLSIALLSYILMSLIVIIMGNKLPENLQFIENINQTGAVFIFVITLFLFSILHFWFGLEEKIIYNLLMLSVVIFGFITILTYPNNLYISIGVSAVVSFFFYYLYTNKKLLNIKIKKYSTVFIIITIVYIPLAILLSKSTINRYLTFSASNFDFGIFAQLFENMAKTGSTAISVERNEIMSHFYNHFSPIYYVLLPLYMISRQPQTLLVIQAFFVLGAVYPLCLIVKKYKLSPAVTLLCGLVLIFTVGFVKPLFFDFHENKFLPFFMLWFIYFFISEKYKISYLFMFLTLMIKEDAAIYVIFMLIYFFIVDKKYKQSLIGFALTILYFVPVMIFIRKYGLDFVGWRYGLYFLPGQDKIIDMVRNILLNPVFFVKNVFSEDCFKYILFTFGSLLFIPLATKDYKKLILLVPMLAINLMTDYSYQHNIGFQYSYGSVTLLVFLYISNIKDMSPELRRIVAVSTVIMSVFITCNALKTDVTGYTKNYNENKEKFEQYERDLDRIPEDVSITVNTFILPHLYDREELYMFEYDKPTDYVILMSNNADERAKFEAKEYYSEYTLVLQNGKMDIYKRYTAPDLLSVV